MTRTIFISRLAGRRKKGIPFARDGRQVMRAWFYRPRLPAIFSALLLVAFTPSAAQSGESRLAISGFDPVAYFTDGKPVPGVPEFEHVWHDARWRFASATH